MADYPDWTAAVEALGYTEESFYVDTEDGWRIPLLHITGKVGEDAQDLDNSLGTVLVLHGSLMSATSFANKGAPTLPFQLADEGFDVWLGSMRGTADSDCTPGSDCGLIAIPNPLQFTKKMLMEMKLLVRMENQLLLRLMTRKVVQLTQ